MRNAAPSLLAALALARAAQAQPATLRAPAIQAFIAAQVAAEARHDWAAVRAGYTSDGQVFGLFYDKDRAPHVHDGPAAADVTVMAALTTVRRNAACAVSPGTVTVAPDGQHATASYTRTDDYDQGTAHVRRVFDQTAIVTLQGGAAKLRQLVSVERPRQ